MVRASFPRLANAEVGSESYSITLTFIERAVALLMGKKGVKKVSRGSRTRAQFLKSLADEVKAVKLEFKCKELRKKQKIAEPDDPGVALRDPIGVGGAAGRGADTTEQPKTEEEKKANKEPGIAHGADIKIKGVKATNAQIDQVNRALGEADKLDAGARASQAMICAGIGESGFQAIRNQGKPPSRYWGVFQGSMDVFGINDTEEQARCFLKGGKGFHGNDGNGPADNGAIGTAKANRGWGPGLIAVTIEGSRSNFSSDSAAEHHYGQYKAEADKILDEYGSGGVTGAGSSGNTTGSGGTTTSTPYRKAYNFSRNKGEDSWQAMDRLAKEVVWPLFVDGDRIYFDSDLTLIAQKPTKIIKKRDSPEIVRWNYTVALRSFASGLSITMICDPDEFRAGEVFKLADFGMASKGKHHGAWLITNISRNRAEISSVFTLRQPITPELEPAPEVGQHTTTSGSTTTSTGGGHGQVDGAIKGSPVAGQAPHSPTHDTAGLSGYPAFDYMAPAGTPCVAPVDGKITRLSGQDPKAGGPAGGALGYSIYMEGDGDSYFMTHLDKVSVKEGDTVKQGDQIAEVAAGPASWSSPHVHMGVKRSGGSWPTAGPNA